MSRHCALADDPSTKGRGDAAKSGTAATTRYPTKSEVLSVIPERCFERSLIRSSLSLIMSLTLTIGSASKIFTHIVVAADLAGSDPVAWLGRIAQALASYFDGWRPVTVIDLGCGTGALAEALAPFVHDVIAVDGSAAMLQAARKRLSRVENVDLRRGALEALRDRALLSRSRTDDDQARPTFHVSHRPERAERMDQRQEFPRRRSGC